METIRFAEELDHIVQPVLSILRVYPGSRLFETLNPTENQVKGMIEQEEEACQPKLFDDVAFYGQPELADKARKFGLVLSVAGDFLNGEWTVDDMGQNTYWNEGF